MGPSAAPRQITRFGLFEVDWENRRLTKGGLRVRLQEQPFQILRLLLERPGEVVTRDELKEKLWAGDTYVDFDTGLNTAVRKLRTAIGDVADNPRFIETVPRVGYRFLSSVSVTEGSVASSTDPEAPAASAETLPDIAVSRDLMAEGTLGSVEVAPVFSRRLLLWPGLVVALFAIGLGVWLWTRSRDQAARPLPIDAIVVLPLQNMSNDPSQEFIADGMSDEIITDLAKLAGPKVISRTSAMQYKGTRKSIPQIARELNVGAVVEGSVERSGDRLRVRVQLIQASTDHHLWAETYDRQLSDVLRLEADLAQDIAQEIQLHLTQRQQRDLANRQPLNPQAFQDYLQGREYWAMRTDESLTKAIEYFQRAIKEDPNDARSYAGLAHCYIVLPMLTPTKEVETQQKARAAATKALALDESLAEAHLAIAEIEFYQDWNFTEAEKEFRRTLELNPNYATGHQWYGEFLSVRGRHEEAMREVEAAIALDPLSAIVHHQAGQSFQQARQYDRAIQEYQQALKLNPSLYVTYEAMYWTYRRQGKFEAASEAMQGASPYWSASSGVATLIKRLPAAYAHDGKEGFLRQSIEMHELFRDSSLYLARDYADLGDKDHALEELERAFNNQNAIRLWILNDVEFDPLRSEPRFRSLVEKIEPRKS